MISFGSLRQEDMMVGVAIGSILLFVIGAAVAMLFHLYAKARLARGVNLDRRRAPPPRRRR
jgi:hypothetical protein